MTFFSKVLLLVLFLSSVVTAQSAVRFVPFAEQRFVSDPQHDTSYIFVDARMMYFEGNGAASAALSQADPDTTEVSNAFFYPCPFSLSQGAELGYELSRDMDIELRIYNMMGNEIYRTEYLHGTQGGLGRGNSRNVYNRIPFTQSTFGSPLSAGAYFFVLMNDGKVIHKGKFAVKPR